LEDGSPSPAADSASFFVVESVCLLDEVSFGAGLSVVSLPVLPALVEEEEEEAPAEVEEGFSLAEELSE